MLPNQKPWRVWYSADNCSSWSSSRASFGSERRAVDMAMGVVGPRILQQLGVPEVALRAVHTGTRHASPVHIVRSSVSATRSERPVIVQLYHGYGRPMTLIYGFAMSDELERRRRSETGPITVRRHVSLAPLGAIEDLAARPIGRVMGDEVDGTTFRGMSIYKVMVCSKEAVMHLEREKQIRAGQSAECLREQRDEEASSDD